MLEASSVIVDLFAVAPVYLSVLFGVAHAFSVVRSLRLLRIFRILKLTEYLGEAMTMRIALRESLRKIIVFLFAVLTIVVIAGAMMYQIEGEAHGFNSIPAGMYWAIVTVTTVGYGDIAPKTVLGRIVASLLMIVGYGIIAVPTGIVSFELARASSGAPDLRLVLSAACGRTTGTRIIANAAERIFLSRTASGARQSGLSGRLHRRLDYRS